MNMLIVVFVIVAAILAFYFYQQTGKTLKRLEAEGFVVDETIPSNPRLVIDRQHERMAVIYASHYESFSFQQIESATIKSAPGTSDDAYRKLVIELNNHPESKIELKGRDQQVRGWVKTINAAKP